MANSPTIKNSSPTHPADARAVYVGVDVGGTTIQLGLVDATGRTLAQQSLPTPAQRSAEEAVRQIAVVVADFRAAAEAESRQLAYLGLAVPGPLDLQHGLVLTPGNLPAWWNYPLRQRVSEACQLPVRFVNDAGAAAYGEYWQGSGTDCQSMVLLTLGTGIGGGIILDGNLVAGAHGCGGECGHIVVDPQADAPRDALDQRGSLEAFCGARGVVHRARQALRADSSLADDQTLTPLAIAEAATAGDALARQVVMETAEYLALGIVTLMHTLDPDSVVLGGAMTFGGAGHPLGEEFLERIRTQVQPRLLPPLRASCRINFAQLGSRAGYVGAAGLARLAHHS